MNLAQTTQTITEDNTRTIERIKKHQCESCTLVRKCPACSWAVLMDILSSANNAIDQHCN